VVSLRHAAALKEIATAKRWPLKTAVEFAIEQLAEQMEVEVAAAPARKARAAA